MKIISIKIVPFVPNIRGLSYGPISRTRGITQDPIEQLFTIRPLESRKLPTVEISYDEVRGEHSLGLVSQQITTLGVGVVGDD